jgi:hypothetical protein
MSRFIHPIHARGLQSRNISAPSTELSDRKIKNYILAGRYGKELQEKLQKELLAKKPKARTTPSLKAFSHLL